MIILNVDVLDKNLIKVNHLSLFFLALTEMSLITRGYMRSLSIIFSKVEELFVNFNIEGLE